MFGSTIVFTGTVVIGETAFRWSVTDGQAQQLIVSHPTLGTQIQRLTASPDAQARLVGRAMLMLRVRTGITCLSPSVRSRQM